MRMGRASQVKWVGAVLGAVLLACTTVAPVARAEPLYLALEVRQAGELIARPKLLGEAGKPLRAERRKPGAVTADYQLVLNPLAGGKLYNVELELVTPLGRGQGQLAIGHGQERRLQLGSRPGELEVSLMLMRVDSPEFRALMQLPEPGDAREAPLTI